MHLVTLVNAVSHVIVLVHCTLMVSMLVNAVIEVMLVNASHVAVHNCFTRLLYSGSNVVNVALQYSFTVLWWLVCWRALYSGSHVGEYCRSHCSTRLLYSGSQYAGGRCTLEIALVNAVGHVAVRVCCIHWRRLHSGGSISECCQLHCSTHSLYSGSQYVVGSCTLEVVLVNAVGHIAVHICCTPAEVRE